MEIEKLKAIVSLVYGKDLVQEDLDMINKHRELEFGSPSGIKPMPGNDDWEKVYFLLKKGNELVAFGRLHSIKVEFRSASYSILGIATIVAIKKMEGYGKLLMKEIKKHIERSGKTAIGFCESAISEFYKKCDYSVLVDGVKSFIFLNEQMSPTPPRPGSSDVIYIDGEDKLFEEICKYPDEKIIASRISW